jgi:hypothetical protein
METFWNWGESSFGVRLGKNWSGANQAELYLASVILSTLGYVFFPGAKYTFLDMTMSTYIISPAAINPYIHFMFPNMVSFWILLPST